MPISEPSSNQAVHGLGGVVKLLVGRIPVARLHFRHQPAVVPHFGHRAADGGPVVVTQKQIRVHTLVATPPASFHHVFHVNSSNPGSVDLNPLFCKPRVVDVADIEVNTYRGAVHVVQKLRSEEHTSELQSRLHLVCRLLLEKKKKRADTRVPIPPHVSASQPWRTESPQGGD